MSAPGPTAIRTRPAYLWPDIAHDQGARAQNEARAPSNVGDGRIPARTHKHICTLRVAQILPEFTPIHPIVPGVVHGTHDNTGAAKGVRGSRKRDERSSARFRSTTSRFWERDAMILRWDMHVTFLLLLLTESV